ncbi:MAG: DUF4440 domain-containing protein [Acidobacteriaceae bacterium]
MAFGMYIVLFSGVIAAQPPLVAPVITKAELVRRTQELYDAYAPGNKRPWQLYYADDAMAFDEKGHSMDKQALLASVEALPPGYTGSIRIVDPQAIFAPGVAILGYACDETETVFGQKLHARYHAVDTWLYRDGSWKIASSQVMRYYEDPAIGTSNPAKWSSFIGVYELSPGNRRTVTQEGTGLFLQRGAGPKVKLLPESGDVFFRAGVEGRILFHRNASKVVDALYDRRNNEDIVWRKVQ